MTYDKAINIKGNLEFVPIIDSFSHSFDNNTDCIQDSNVIRLFATKDIPENTTFTRNYGCFDNYTYLLKHGFIPHDNPYHMFLVYPEHLSN